MKLTPIGQPAPAEFVRDMTPLEGPMLVRCYEYYQGQANPSPATPPVYHVMIYGECFKNFPPRLVADFDEAVEAVRLHVGWYDNHFTAWCIRHDAGGRFLFADLMLGRLLFRATVAPAQGGTEYGPTDQLGLPLPVTMSEDNHEHD